MSRLEDYLIQRLAESEEFHAYTHEVKKMAQEILERRTAEREAAKARTQQSNVGFTGQPWPQGTYP